MWHRLLSGEVFSKRMPHVVEYLTLLPFGPSRECGRGPGLFGTSWHVGVISTLVGVNVKPGGSVYSSGCWRGRCVSDLLLNRKLSGVKWSESTRTSWSPSVLRHLLEILKKEGLEAFTVKKVNFRKCSPHLPGYSSTRPRPTHSAFLNS